MVNRDLEPRTLKPGTSTNNLITNNDIASFSIFIYLYVIEFDSLSTNGALKRWRGFVQFAERNRWRGIMSVTPTTGRPGDSSRISNASVQSMRDPCNVSLFAQTASRVERSAKRLKRGRCDESMIKSRLPCGIFCCSKSTQNSQK